jgi:L-fuconolactonase
LLNSPAEGIWNKLGELELRFDALVQPRHLPMLHEFCCQNPELPVVIDHAAKPKAALAGDSGAFQKWATGMAHLARDTSSYCKISGLLTELAPSQLVNAYEVLQPTIDKLLELFGPERLMWGSDWPVLTLASNYADWNQITTQLLSSLDATSSSKILGGTCQKFYNLEFST